MIQPDGLHGLGAFDMQEQQESAWQDQQREHIIEHLKTHRSAAERIAVLRPPGPPGPTGAPGAPCAPGADGAPGHEDHLSGSFWLKVFFAHDTVVCWDRAGGA